MPTTYASFCKGRFGQRQQYWCLCPRSPLAEATEAMVVRVSALRGTWVAPSCGSRRVLPPAGQRAW